jgi:hypothetical protein
MLDNEGNVWSWSSNDPTPTIIFENIVAYINGSYLSADGILYNEQQSQRNTFKLALENVMLPCETIID